MKVSIIVPSYNACERLYNNLISLGVQSHDKSEFEVIVVDDGSTDDTSEMLSSFAGNFDLKYILLKENRGRSYARNCGLDTSSGDLIIFHDSDMIAERNFVSKHIENHKDKNSVVCGNSWRRIYTYYYKDFKGYLEKNFNNKVKAYKLSGILYNKKPLLQEKDIVNGNFLDYSFDLTDKSLAEKRILDYFGPKLEGFNYPWSMFVTNNCSVLKENIVSVGSFDNEFVNWGCEDLELGYRLYKKGFSFIKDNEIMSVHQEHPINFSQNGFDSLYYFTKKHNCIDLLLYYYGNEICLNKIQTNKILYEIQKLEELEQIDWLIELYRNLLMLLRDKRNKNHIDKRSFLYEMSALKKYIAIQKEDILDLLCRFENEVKTYSFIESFKALILKLYNKKLENIV